MRMRIEIHLESENEGVGNTFTYIEHLPPEVSSSERRATYIRRNMEILFERAKRETEETIITIAGRDRV